MAGTGTRLSRPSGNCYSIFYHVVKRSFLHPRAGSEPEERTLTLASAGRLRGATETRAFGQAEHGKLPGAGQRQRGKGSIEMLLTV